MIINTKLRLPLKEDQIEISQCYSPRLEPISSWIGMTRNRAYGRSKQSIPIKEENGST